ncbi:hypothetical protein [Anaerotardibacter muris]|uniref:hypothetical protein n=1 Tax=Anaerotardibacter muris TaxID=2941505 RepID=UPI00203A7D87|nr:hypothetical protein [Anaerotardibacter muris]
MSKIHYAKLAFRGFLLVCAVALLILDPTWFTGDELPYHAIGIGFTLLVWVSFIPEMIRRFFPNKDESAGCQKQFVQNFKPRPATTLSQEIARILGRTQEEIKKKDFRDVVVIALFWIALNAIIGVLYFTGVLTAEMLICISMFYAVSDIICILYWCPFQTLVMKNTCCAQCRIYNWDYAMMFTPLVFIGGFWALSLLLCGFAILLKWEFDYYRYPHRFAEETNEYLSCDGCDERLCTHKASVKRLLADKTRALAKAQAEARAALAKLTDFNDDHH